MRLYFRERRVYSSDVTDKEWAILEPLIPAAKQGGRPQEIARREIVNGILYVLRSGCPWRMLPHDFPNWSTVYLYFREWKQVGIWEQVNAALRRNFASALGVILNQAQPLWTVNPSKPVRCVGMRVATMAEKN